VSDQPAGDVLSQDVQCSWPVKAAEFPPVKNRIQVRARIGRRGRSGIELFRRVSHGCKARIDQSDELVLFFSVGGEHRQIVAEPLCRNRDAALSGANDPLRRKRIAKPSELGRMAASLRNLCSVRIELGFIRSEIKYRRGRAGAGLLRRGRPCGERCKKRERAQKRTQPNATGAGGPGHFTRPKALPEPRQRAASQTEAMP